MLSVHVVSHTHWDREWYHPAERFRQRLVALVDELLDDPQTDGSSFLLDGQTVVLEDYLDVCPERASELASALRDGRLEAGPWYVLPDELIPSGEGLVRNLLAGRRTLRALRAEAPPVLYCPDSFGHPAALPTLANGFGFDVAIVWRGFGGARFPASDAVWWIAPSGEHVLTFHLPRSGYELGANLPSSAEAAHDRWNHAREQLSARTSLHTVLLLNGADHHARQARRTEAIRALVQAAAPDHVRSGSLRDFVAELAHRAGAWGAGATLPEVRGELRDSYGYTWSLQGTLASRTPQKRTFVRRERELLRDVEPWTALAAVRTGVSRRHLVAAAWRPLLLSQPHDTLCGCSVDQVARAMDTRLESVAAQSAGLREDALLDLIGHDRDEARQRRDDWTPMLLVRNRAARARSGVAIVELTSTIADVPVGPGSTHVSLSKRKLPRVPRLAGAGPAQVLTRRLDHDRTEAPRAYPDNDAVARLQAAVWIENAPAYGLAAFGFSTSRARPTPANGPVHVGDGVMSNGRITLRFSESGALVLEQDGRAVRDFVVWESRRDRGDLYTPAIREPKLTPRLLNMRLVHRGPLRGAVEQRWRLRDGDNRVDARLRFVLDADAHWLRVHVRGMNGARDHRLRLRFRTGVESGRPIADAAFGPVRREPVRVSEKELEIEEPPPTAPLHRYVSLFNERAGATLFSDGLTEYETDGDTIALTVLRSVGELSRSDIVERPGHAGWPAPTPDAQCLGPFDAELAVMLHGPASATMIDAIERAADDVLYPLTGETLRSALAVPPAVHGVSLEGHGLALSTIKESDDGEWLVLRCVNLLEQECSGAWRLDREPGEVHLARLDETPITPLQTRGDTIPFLAPPRGVITILVR
ncbi:MAG TPA: glycoside hydrolase family 38 C-terminal domain-containing protein [Gemmatimonadaceae bacterium]|nr:glycoside hydrolase family 38 C-terminal domain-containing protein [Gemmatimonadaceae bacterium]